MMPRSLCSLLLAVFNILRLRLARPSVAVFQDSTEPYLPLALKYRRKTCAIAQRIALDILPLKFQAQDDPFLAEIAKGEVIYER